MPMFKYINNTFKFWTSIFSPIPRTKMKFSINFAAMLNLVRQIISSLNRNPSLELLDITHALYTYTCLLTGRISKLCLHSLKSYTCVPITSWITLVYMESCRGWRGVRMHITPFGEKNFPFDYFVGHKHG